MRSDLARFGRGFVYAWNGIRAAVLEERNFRFHLCAASYAIAVGCLAGLDAVQFSLLFVCIFGVMALELMNSAVERAVDKPDTTHWWSAGAAKDMAAAAVLLAALGSIAVALCLFAHAETLQRVWAGITHSPITIALWLITLPLAYLFIFCFGTHKEGSAAGDESTQA